MSGQSTWGLFDETLVVCGTEFGRTPVLKAFVGDGLVLENVDSEVQYYPQMVIWSLEFVEAA